MGWGRSAEFRTTVADDGVSGFRATIAPERNLAMIAFLAVWLAFWALGELAALSWVVLVPAFLIGWGLGLVPPALPGQLAREASGKWPEILFVALVWFPFWTFAGVVVFRALRWQVNGREVIAVRDGVLEVRRETGRSGRSRAFALSGVRNLRYAPEPTATTMSFGTSSRGMLGMLRAEGGNVAFDHGGRVHRFGIGLSEAEANRLIATIRQRVAIPDDGWEPLPVGP